VWSNFCTDKFAVTLCSLTVPLFGSCKFCWV
jgi:hypothetical protein